jgi:chitinase
MLAVMVLGCVRSAEGAVTSFNRLGLISDRAAVKQPAPGSGTRDRKAPTVPGSFKAQSATANSITTSWAASSDNRGVTSYRTYRNKKMVANGLWTTYTFTGLACGTTYALAVDAADAAGNRSAKAQIAASTSACTPPTGDTTPPSPVSGLHVTGTTQTSITYAWNAATDNIAVAGYNMLKAGVKVGSTSSLTYTYSGLACGTTYTLAVQTYDAAGNTSNPALATATNSTNACTPTPDTTPPSAPTNLAAAPSQTSVTLSWSASSDNTGVTGYTAYNGPGTLGTTASTSYTVNGLNCNTNYSFSVDAYDAAGNHSTKTTASTTTTPLHAAAGIGNGFHVALGIGLESVLSVTAVRLVRPRLPRGDSRRDRAGRRRLVSGTDDQPRLFEDLDKRRGLPPGYRSLGHSHG